MAVNLQKGQKISLDKEAGVKLTKIIMGLGWDAVKSKGFFGFGAKTPDIDLDASCILFDGEGNPTDAAWFRQLKTKDGSVVHTGDNRTGAGDGDIRIGEVNIRNRNFRIFECGSLKSIHAVKAVEILADRIGRHAIDRPEIDRKARGLPERATIAKSKAKLQGQH